MRWFLVIMCIGIRTNGLGDRECKLCQSPSQRQAQSCPQTEAPHSRHVPITAAATALGERGYNLAGDHDILVSRYPLFNMTIKDPTKCVRFQDSDGREQSFRPAENFATYRYFSTASTAHRSFAFRLINVFPSVWESYIDFRHRSSLIVDALSKYDDLFSTLNNIGVSKQQNFQSSYKKLQRISLDKRVSFYHVRAQVVLGEFEMKKPMLDNKETHFSTLFLNYIQQQILSLPDNGTGVLWDEKFFLLFGTHYVRRGLFGGYIDLIISPWDILCEVPVHSNLSTLARCITTKLNTKFGLGISKGVKVDENATCPGFSFWMQSDQDVLAVISGSDYDFQTAVSIGVRYPVYEDQSDKPLMRGWLHSLYHSPGLVDVVVEPICQVFPEASLLKKACEKNLLRYMRMNEPILRGSDEMIDDCGGGKRLVMDMGFGNMREGCVSTARWTNICPSVDEEKRLNGATKPSLGLFELGIILIMRLGYGLVG